jgi:hypothetical protein
MQRVGKVHTFGAPIIGMKHASSDSSPSKAMADKPMKNLHIPFE